MNIRKTIGLIVLAVMAAAIVILGIRVAGLVDKTMEEAATTPTAVPAFGNVMQITPDPNAPTPEPMLRTGSQGAEVTALQTRLKELGFYTGEIDGQYGPGTKEAVQRFQRQHGLGADGIVGSEMRAALESDNVQTAAPTEVPTPVSNSGNMAALPASTPMLRAGDSGDEVKALQMRLKELGYLTGEADGIFGNGTKMAVRTFQQQHGLGADGIAGAQTWAMLYAADVQTAVPTATPAPLPDSVSGELPMLVNRSVAVPDGYQPDDLVVMNDYCDGGIVIIKEANTRGQREAVDALMAMLRAAHQDGITVWQISEGYRTVERQQELFDEQVKVYREKNNLSRSDAISATRQTVADPGHSEHHTGLAFDVTVPGMFFKDTEQSKWLAENCWDYGFIIRYTMEKESITGFLAEPWHIRYVGTEAARIMRDGQLCLEEYIDRYGN